MKFHRRLYIYILLYATLRGSFIDKYSNLTNIHKFRVFCALAYNHKPKKFCTFPGFLKWFSLRNLTSERRTKDLTTKGLLHGPLRHRNSPTDEPNQNGRLINPINPWCGPALLCLSFSLAEISRLKSSKFYFMKKSSCLLTTYLRNDGSRNFIPRVART